MLKLIKVESDVKTSDAKGITVPNGTDVFAFETLIFKITQGEIEGQFPPFVVGEEFRDGSEIVISGPVNA